MKSHSLLRLALAVALVGATVGVSGPGNVSAVGSAASGTVTMLDAVGAPVQNVGTTSGVAGACLAPGLFASLGNCTNGPLIIFGFANAGGVATLDMSAPGTYNIYAEIDSKISGPEPVVLVAGDTFACTFRLVTTTVQSLGCTVTHGTPPTPVNVNGTVTLVRADGSPETAGAAGYCVSPATVVVLGSCTSGPLVVGFSNVVNGGVVLLHISYAGTYNFQGWIEHTLLPAIPVVIGAGDTSFACTIQKGVGTTCTVSSDSDGDGVDDVIDTGVGAFTDTNTPPTYGQIVDTGGLAVHISDLASPLGVRVQVAAGTGSAQLSACGFPTSVAAGSDITITCGSITIAVKTGSAKVTLGDGSASVTLSDGDVAKIDNALGGGLSVVVLNGSVAITVDGTTREVTPSSGPISVQAWHFAGFSGDIRSAPYANVIEGGESIGYRFGLTDGSGAPVTTLGDAKLFVTPVSCSSWAPLGPATIGDTRLTNQSSGRYMLRWKTPRTAQACYLTQLDIGDGVTHDSLIGARRS